MKSIYDMPPVWTLESAVGAYILARWLPIWDFSHLVPGWLGWIVMAAGIALVLWSAMWFRRKSTTLGPRNKPTTLIVEGPYRFSRNPIYSGMALFLLGWALWLGALSAVFVPFIFARLITQRFILKEEENLRQEFGEQTEAFFAKTRRW